MKTFAIWDRVIVTDKITGKKTKAMVTARVGDSYMLFYSDAMMQGTIAWPASSLSRDVEPAPSEG